MLEFRHQWRALFAESGQSGGLKLRCDYCKAEVEVLMLDSGGELFLRTQLLTEGEHPVTQQELEDIGRSVYDQYVQPMAGPGQDGTGRFSGERNV